ncbi:MAG: TonB-dependent receptor [Acidobacteria bacterium]|nr:TonB-dependent receptor [Acidobacteriota bacterium]
MKLKHSRVRTTTATLAALLSCSTLLSSQTGAQTLKTLTLEELSEIQVVSVGRRPERAYEAAAALSVITQDDIRRSGVQSLADALRLANGMEVARSSGNSWNISARGFNGSSNKMQVLIDGRSVYSPLFSGTFWDVQDTMLDDVDRIEVIRGPGATLWGSNAVNGVINVITKRTSDTQGGLLVAGAGNEERVISGLRYGGPVGTRGHYRVYGRFSYKDALVFSDGRSAEDPLRRGFAGFRTDLNLSGNDQFTFQGDVHRGNAERFAQDDVDARGGNLLGRWTRQLSNGSELQIQSYYDRTSRSIPPVFDEVRNTFDIESQQNLPVGERQIVVWGLGYRASADRTRKFPILFFEPQNRTVHLFHLFAQDEFTVVNERLHLIVGSKFERNTYTDWEVQPSIRLAWTVANRQLLWGSVSRAVRIPTRLDTDVVIPGPPQRILGNPEQESEELIAYEIGYRYVPQERYSFNISTYYNDYDRIRSQEGPLSPGGPIVLGNTLRGRSYGVELGSLFQVQPWWQVRAGYSNLQVRLERKPGSSDIAGGRSEANDPKNMFFLRSSMNLPRRVELDFWLRHASALPNPVPLPGYVTFDVRLGWKPVENLELSIVGQNLPEKSHGEFQSTNVAIREEVQRGVYGRIVWGF